MRDLHERLLEAIAVQMDLDADSAADRVELRDILRDIARHGADAGWPGFTYTTDCVKFYEANMDDVWELAQEAADDQGAANVPALVAGFVRADMADTPSGFANLLAWFALEEVARWFDDGNASDAFYDEPEADEDEDEEEEQDTEGAAAGALRSADFDRFSLRMSLEQAQGASHQGDCEADVRALIEAPAIAAQLAAIPADDIRATLREYGAWDEAQLADEDMIRVRMVWIAAGDIREEAEEDARAQAQNTDTNTAAQ